MKTSARHSLRVCVAGWTYSRNVIVEKDRVLMEIARTANNCHHCPTCRRRVATVEAALNGTPYVWKWEFLPQGGMWLSLSRTEGKDPVVLLQEATGLNVTN